MIRNRPFEPASSKGLFLLTLRVLAIALAVHCGSDVGVAQLRTVFPETSMRRDKPLFAQAMYRAIHCFQADLQLSRQRLLGLGATIWTSSRDEAEQAQLGICQLPFLPLRGKVAIRLICHQSPFQRFVINPS